MPGFARRTAGNRSAVGRCQPEVRDAVTPWRPTRLMTFWTTSGCAPPASPVTGEWTRRRSGHRTHPAEQAGCGARMRGRRGNPPSGQPRVTADSRADACRRPVNWPRPLSPGVTASSHHAALHAPSRGPRRAPRGDVAGSRPPPHRSASHRPCQVRAFVGGAISQLVPDHAAEEAPRRRASADLGQPSDAQEAAGGARAATNRYQFGADFATAERSVQQSSRTGPCRMAPAVRWRTRQGHAPESDQARTDRRRTA